MTKRSSFWGNFWGETGRNSGKWISNKVFGASGWATPKRILFGEDTTSIKRGRGRNVTSNNTNNANSDNQELLKSQQLALEEKELKFKQLNQEKILEMAKNIKFSSTNLDSICSTLDDLMLGATKASNFMDYKNFNDNIFVHKINAGIMRLQKLKENEMAEFYKQQLKGLKKTHFTKHTLPIVIYVSVTLIILFLYIKVFIK